MPTWEEEVQKNIKLSEKLHQLLRADSVLISTENAKETQECIASMMHNLTCLESLLIKKHPLHSEDLSPAKFQSDENITLFPKFDKMKLSYHTLIECIGEDPSREGLLKTPHRAAKAFLELTVGDRQDLKKLINEAIYKSDANEMVIVKDIELYSLCEHHLLPFMGKCHVGYIPNGSVIGLSKIARIVDYYARRLQIQENLTCQIAKCLEEIIGAAGVAVVIEAEHMCMRMRGVGKQNSMMKTSATLGVMKEDYKTRTEFLNLISSTK
mmetsp:Transcript_37956/g.44243  ORF Transcript_37956/g.44243 Transcript_37956/m.44243 type:complete len:268 (-) Transcript_37956:160-963(-)|eukprot:CAMPEP_0176442680 /NCGR_PEP_ID=MMETSP0127-20121128/21967_1 /TAXON_ID=938130 /ORGANISM="Platyophrya macrostoma, Strain WH" /LENGTH=267 /DNA_ID=CAMNT_0017827755 /DNA_START=20 /DNA_END=823 /DNA_ORIENTATION=+